MNTQKTWNWMRAVAGLLVVAALMIGCGKTETHSEDDGHGHGKTSAPAQDAHKGHNHGPGVQH